MKFIVIIFVTSFLLIWAAGGSYSQCWTCGTATGTGSISFGSTASSLGNTAFSCGYSAIAEGHHSIAIGRNSYALGALSCAIGQEAKSLSDQSYTFGKYIESHATGAITIGTCTSVLGQALINNLPYSLMVGFLSNKPTLFVGTTMTGDETGKVGISTSQPLQPLHINGKTLITGQDASLLFADEPPQNDLLGDWGIEYHNGLNFWKPYKPGGTYGNYFLLLADNGKVGIGMNERDPLPKAKLDVNGDLRVANLAAVTGLKMVTVDENGILSNHDIIYGDNLGDHIARQNINLNGYFLSGNGNDDGIYVQSDGKVGIGTNVPLARLDVVYKFHSDVLFRATGNYKSNVWVGNDYYSLGLGVNSSGMGFLYETVGSPNPLMVFKSGKIGIGAEPGGGNHMLFVANGITTEEVKVMIQDNWPDYVFDRDYCRMTLEDLKSFVQTNKHLPGIPTEDEVKNDGIELGEMNVVLLKKIEELTLYLIEQETKISDLQKRIFELEKENQ